MTTRAPTEVQGTPISELGKAVDEALLSLGDGVNRVERKQYRAYQRLRNFACVCPPQRSRLLVYLRADPKHVDLVPGFTRDVSGLGHHGTGDLEVQLRTPRWSVRRICSARAMRLRDRLTAHWS